MDDLSRLGRLPLGEEGRSCEVLGCEIRSMSSRKGLKLRKIKGRNVIRGGMRTKAEHTNLKRESPSLKKDRGNKNMI